MGERGKLVLSTKSALGARKVTVAVCGAMFIIMALVMIININTIKSAFAKLFNSEGLGLLIVVAAICFFLIYPVFLLIILTISSKSYCDVYENKVVGKTAMDKWKPGTMQDFEISYNEILNVAEEKMAIVIYTKYTNYKVLANKNRAEALNEIRLRIANSQ